MKDIDIETLHNLLSAIFKTHIIAITENDGQATVHVVSKADRVDIAVTMPTWLEELAKAARVLQESMDIPPEIISGEALICSWWAWLAIAHVWQRNQQWSGWSDDVPLAVRLVVSIAGMLPDTSNGARFVFSRADLRRKRVLELIGGMRLKARFG